MCKLCEINQGNASQFYSDMLRNEPEKIPAVFRELHHAKDVARFQLAGELSRFLNSDEPDIPWEVFCSSRLHVFLEEIARDGQVWSVSREDPRVEHYVRDVISCILAFAEFLVLDLHNDSIYGAYTEIFLHALPPVWARTWKKGILPNKARLQSDMNRHLIGALVHLQDCHMYLRKFHNVEKSKYSDYEWKVVFYCWISCSSPKARHRAVCNLFHLGDSTCGHRVGSLIEKTAVEIGISREVVDAVFKSLRDPELRSGDLRMLLAWVALSMRHIPPAIEKKFSQASVPLLQCFKGAYQRECCSGKVEAKFCQQTSDLTFIVMGDLLLCSHDLGVSSVLAVPEITLMVSEAIVPALLAENKAVVDALVLIMNIFATAAKMGHDKEPTSQYLSMAAYVKSCYPETLQQLRALLPKLPESKLLTRSLTSWAELGNILNLKDTVAEIGHSKGYRLPAKPCHWRECLCRKLRAPHHMRVCKGCWHAFYCSSQCQAQDWVHGRHRDVCAGRRTKDGKPSVP